ncbi:hypothetical protein BDP55DRAFT_765716 [Colletotrichum godetiae]|uniref:Uncharacterized protein n=1 Tax=Colletotrichum godetiae TaxID=1209918 RepID=A0AAJ0AS95_9PEZI|nr:uncharacterized protein BDP55DRAFT_765716 [Colletotrichum godetiae]KAK1689451.1 hypothetical protein BDP55DRAFT_765716 [Colletotrichum godetiae]
MTVHSELEATEDLEEDLENYVRLVRLGRFKAAQRHFKQNLIHSIDNPYVLDQYCSSLVAMSDFHALARITETMDSEPRSGAVHVSIIGQLHRAEYLSGVRLLKSERAVEEFLNPSYFFANTKGHWPKLDSTEFSVLLSIGLPEYDFEATDKFLLKHHSLATVYQHLLAEARIWDFRDLLDELLVIQQSSVYVTLKHLHQDGSHRQPIDFIRSIENNWGTTIGDESSSFALLEIFTTLVLASMEGSEDIGMVKAIFRITERYARGVLEIKSTNSKSRPYLRWIIAKILLEQYADPKIAGFFTLSSHLRRLRGICDRPRVIVPLEGMIMYAPDDDEAPEWDPDTSIRNHGLY